MTTSGITYNWSNTTQWSNMPTSQVDKTFKTNNNINDGYKTIQTSNQNSNYQMNYSNPTQENRKDMITRLYRTILGREPDIAGLNYYLFNTHISEAQIAKEMFESTEHADLLAKAKDVREMIRIVEESSKKIKEMEYALESLQILNENYKNLLEQKNQLINQLRQINLSGNNNQDNQGFYQQSPNVHRPSISQNNGVYNLQELPERTEVATQENESSFMLKDPFEEEDGSEKGFMAWIKSWFKFV